VNIGDLAVTSAWLSRSRGLLFRWLFGPLVLAPLDWLREVFGAGWALARLPHAVG
jgi:hypothetical protein